MDLPAPDAYAPWLAQRREALLRQARDGAQRLRAGGTGGPMEVLRLWNDVGVALSNARFLGALLSQVHPASEVRAQSTELEAQAIGLATEIAMDRDVYEALAACVGSDDLDAAAVRVLEHSLRDFRLQGVDRDEPTRQRLLAISAQLVDCSQRFDRTINESVVAIRVAPEQLAGLPEEFVASHPAVDGQVEITTEYGDYLAVATSAHDRSLREEMSIAFWGIAWPENDALLREMLLLRHEKARLLGYPDWPSYDAALKMVDSGDAVAELIDRVADLVRPSAARDYQDLLDRKRQDVPDATDLDDADRRYYVAVLGKERFDVDPELVRSYLDFTKVLAGLLDVTGRLFGLTYLPVTDTPGWDDAVGSYDVMDTATGAGLGRMHLDLHPRDGKYSWFAMFELVRGVRGRQLPEGVLVCNFSHGSMSHRELAILFHEFGHLLHHIIGGHQDWVRFSGVATEWDFVEAPSQMLEEWAWDPAVLASFATNEAGQPIPADLVGRLHQAEGVGRGLERQWQLFLSAVAHTLHRDVPDDITTAVQNLDDRLLLAHMPARHIHTAFGHLNEYSSAYYTYVWSFIIAKDLFSAFDRKDLLAPGVAHSYRDLVLAPGGSRDAADLVADFLGRPSTFEAFEAWLRS
jgi:thimet oligopeptidase